MKIRRFLLGAVLAATSLFTLVSCGDDTTEKNYGTTELTYCEVTKDEFETACDASTFDNFRMVLKIYDGEITQGNLISSFIVTKDANWARLEMTLISNNGGVSFEYFIQSKVDSDDIWYSVYDDEVYCGNIQNKIDIRPRTNISGEGANTFDKLYFDSGIMTYVGENIETSIDGAKYLYNLKYKFSDKKLAYIEMEEKLLDEENHYYSKTGTITATYEYGAKLNLPKALVDYLNANNIER